MNSTVIGVSRLALVLLALGLAACSNTTPRSDAPEIPCDQSQWLMREFWAAASVTQVRACITAGVDVSARDAGEWTPLHHAAAWNDNPEVVAVLVAAGADVDARNAGGWTALHEAADFSDSPEVIRALLEAGGAVNALDNRGCTPLDWATYDNGDPDMIEALAEAGGVNGESCPLGQTEG